LSTFTFLQWAVTCNFTLDLWWANTKAFMKTETGGSVKQWNISQFWLITHNHYRTL